jgi:hypothetical protein
MNRTPIRHKLNRFGIDYSERANGFVVGAEVTRASVRRELRAIGASIKKRRTDFYIPA